jgi:hypothetical protein
MLHRLVKVPGHAAAESMCVSFVMFVLLLPAISTIRPGLTPKPNALIEWCSAMLQGVHDSKSGGPMVGRALAIVHTCIYDAWAAYDDRAVGTQLQGALRRPANERTQGNKERAISYAAYRALSDVLPADTESVYKSLMRQLGYDPDDNSLDIETPTGIGNVACAAVLESRHHDKSNQLGDIEAAAQEISASAGIRANAAGPYSDWSGFRPVNPPTAIPVRFPFVKPLNPNHWQPLTYTDRNGSLVLQMFAGAQWCYVTPFALDKRDELRGELAPGPAQFGAPEYEEQARELVDLSANLTDRQKMIAEFWSNSPDSKPPLSHWLRFAEFVSERDHHTLDDDVKLFFVLSNVMLDADIAAWDAKRAYDSVRPITAIALLFNGKKIRAWGGPGKGTVEMDGSQWLPYEPATFPTPPSPEFVSEQSTQSVAAARILALWTGSDRFGDSVTLSAGSSKIEPGLTPAKPMTLKWSTFTEAADEAGMSGHYGGIQFPRGDLAGRKLGRLVADRVWAKAQSYFNGTAKPVFVDRTRSARP